MATLTETKPDVNSMTPTIARLKRDHGFHRAAQLLADASRCRAGLAPQPLVSLNPHERAWFKQTARHAIEIFELITQDREPDAEQDKREAVAGDNVRRYTEALMNRLSIERSRARRAAEQQGHDLGYWNVTGKGDGCEAAYCRRCGKPAAINIGADPILSGSALSEGCLTAAEGSQR